MIRLSNVSKRYFGQPLILEDVCFELKKGEFLTVVGGSGAGKTSLLKLLATEELPTTGEIVFFGYPFSKLTPKQLTAIRRLLGYIPQDVRLISDLSVFDNVALSLTLAKRRFLSASFRQRIDDLLAELGLVEKKQIVGATV